MKAKTYVSVIRRLAAVLLSLVLAVGMIPGTVVSADTKSNAPGVPTIKLKNNKNGSIKVTLGKTANADGFEVFLGLAGSGFEGYSVTDVRLNGKKARTLTIDGLEEEKYEVCAHAYKLSDGKKVYGRMSKTKKVGVTIAANGTGSDDSADISKYSRLEVGDTFKFGSYEQDNNTKNGNEEIEWIVLSKSKSEIFVVSKYALDCKPYNTEYIEITWEECSLRKWLNDDFYNTAFSKSEKSLIKTTKVKNDDNPIYGTQYGAKGGNDTKDKIFLLSLDDIKNTSYGFGSNYDQTDITRTCTPTAYAVAQGIRIYFGLDSTSGTTEEINECNWLLRSPGRNAFTVADVDFNGRVAYYGNSVHIVTFGVRPALILDLKP